MIPFFRTLSVFLFLSLVPAYASDDVKIVLIAGAVKKVDRTGHHDYLGGCRLMQELLKQTVGVEAVLVKKDWPSDESIFEGAKAIVFYTEGGAKSAADKVLIDSFLSLREKPKAKK